MTITTEQERTAAAIRYAEEQIRDLQSAVRLCDYAEDIDGNLVYEPGSYPEEKREFSAQLWGAREAPARWAVRRSRKRPERVSRNEPCARSKGTWRRLRMRILGKAAVPADGKASLRLYRPVRKELRKMVLAEAPRMYPVFTHHVKELKAAARYLVQRIERYAESHAPDWLFNTMLARHDLVIRTMREMENSKNPFVYLTREERDLVARVNNWLKEHPEHRTA